MNGQNIDRRTFLGGAGFGATALLAGCSAVPQQRPQMWFAVSNARDVPVEGTVTFMKPNVTEASEAVVYENDFEVAPMDNGEPTVRRHSAVAPDKAYRIEITEGSPHNSHHYHYRPDCGPTVDHPQVMVHLNPDGGVRFTQTTCSSDELFL